MDARESRTMRIIERAACLAHAVAQYADFKFDQLVSGGRGINEALVAEEALVLHIKVLALLEYGMDTAREYWTSVTDDHVRVASARLNDAVQWMRERFNESLDRASFAGSRCDRDGGVCVEKLLYDKALEMVMRRIILQRRKIS